MSREITLKKYKPGSTIVAMGGPATDLYILVRGRVGVSRGARGGELPPMHVLGPGAIFGEASLLVGMHYKGYAHAETDVLCVVIPQEKLPELANKLI